MIHGIQSGIKLYWELSESSSDAILKVAIENFKELQVQRNSRSQIDFWLSHTMEQHILHAT